MRLTKAISIRSRSSKSTNSTFFKMRSRSHSAGRKKRSENVWPPIFERDTVNPNANQTDDVVQAGPIAKLMMTCSLVFGPPSRRKLRRSIAFVENHYFNLKVQNEQRTVRMINMDYRLQQIKPEFVEMVKYGIFRDENQLLRGKRMKINRRQFALYHRIGKGTFGRVYLVKQNDTGQWLTMKIQLKHHLRKKIDSSRHIRVETDNLMGNDNDWLVKLFYSFQDEQFLYLVEEYMAGGDLESFLQRPPFRRVNEDECQAVIFQIALALDSIHSLNIVYRDLNSESFQSPANVFLSQPQIVRGLLVKLADTNLCSAYDKQRNSGFLRNLSWLKGTAPENSNSLSSSRTSSTSTPQKTQSVRAIENSVAGLNVLFDVNASDSLIQRLKTKSKTFKPVDKTQTKISSLDQLKLSGYAAIELIRGEEATFLGLSELSQSSNSSIMEEIPFTKTLKTPSPPAKIKLWLENFDNDNFNNNNLSADQSINNNEPKLASSQSIDHHSKVPTPLNLQTQFNKINLQSTTSSGPQKSGPLSNDLSNTNQSLSIYHHHPLLPPENAQSANKSQTIESQQQAPETDEYKNTMRIQSRSTGSQDRMSWIFKSKKGNTVEAKSEVFNKHRELQAKSKVSLVYDDSTEEESEQSANLSHTPSFRCHSSDEDDSCTNSLESSNDKKLKALRAYKSEPQLSSFEDSQDQSLNSGMYQDSLRYHSQNALKKSAKVFETVTVCGVDYFVLNTIGEGGSSKVYQVCDCLNKEFYALKVVDMSKMADNLKTLLKKEIEILNLLKGCKRVIQLYGYELNKETDKLMLIMEKGDSDLNTVLSKMIQNESRKKGLDLHTIKHYWNEMLKAVDEMHKKGVVHSDLKPVNFVIVKGNLKIIDFGIADAINPDHTSVIKSNLVGTINFMSPESLIGRPNLTNGRKGIKVNCKSDVWSLGCILFNMCFGRTPFGHIDQIYEKINAICNPKHVIQFPAYENAHAVDCIKRCLDRDINTRPSVAELFQHPFLNCDREKLIIPTSRIPAWVASNNNNNAARNALLDKRMFDDIGSEVNKLTPRSFAKFKTVMKKELTKYKK